MLGRADELDRLHDQIAGANDHGQRVTLLEDFLVGRVRDFILDPLVAAAVAWLGRETGRHRIDDLTRYMSHSALERRFDALSARRPRIIDEVRLVDV